MLVVPPSGTQTMRSGGCLGRDCCTLACAVSQLVGGEGRGGERRGGEGRGGEGRGGEGRGGEGQAYIIHVCRKHTGHRCKAAGHHSSGERRQEEKEQQPAQIHDLRSNTVFEPRFRVRV